MSNVSTLKQTGITLLRVFAGLAIAFGHGIRKLPPSDGFVEGLGNMGFPVPIVFAWAAGSAEFFGGILLAIGLWTRPASLFLAITLGVAAFIRHASDPFSGKEKALLFFVVFIYFLLTGAGNWSVDNIFRNRR